MRSNINLIIFINDSIIFFILEIIFSSFYSILTDIVRTSIRH